MIVRAALFVLASWIAAGAPAAATQPAPPAAAESPAAGEMSFRPATPPDPARRQRLARWLESHGRRLEPLRAAAGELARVLAHRPGSGGRLPQCRELGRALRRSHDDPPAPAPEFAVAVHVSSAVEHWVRSAVACLSERLSAVPYELARAERSLEHASLALRRYGLGF